MKDKKTYQKTDHAADPYLFEWTATNLPTANNYFITDIDMIIRSRSGQIMIVEIKRRNATVNGHQRTTYEILDQCLQAGIDAHKAGFVLPSMQYPVKLQYLGFHVLQFENTTFEDGPIYWDGQQISVDQVKQILSFETSPYVTDQTY